MPAAAENSAIPLSQFRREIFGYVGMDMSA
jgi:hypothetical protein